MKAAMLTVLLIVLSTGLRGAPPDAAQLRVDTHVRQADFRFILGLVSDFVHKPVIVTSEDDLKRQASFSITAPYSVGTLRKVIDAILICEGYELVEEPNEMRLRRVLTDAQCDVLNRSIGRQRLEPLKELPIRVVGPLRAGDPPPKQRVIIRPEQDGKATEQKSADGNRPSAGQSPDKH